MVHVKICGITSREDAFKAADLGVDALGFVFAPSPRQITPDQARGITENLPPFVQSVGVFVNEDLDVVRAIRDYCHLDYVQLHGDETEEYVEKLGNKVIKAIRVCREREFDCNAYPAAVLLLDTYMPGLMGGTGRTFDWTMAMDAARKRPLILAGGLNPG
ncbi:MAG: phosphoribosylanthranilate isomerase, partial [Pseudomonadota bacterium]